MAIRRELTIALAEAKTAGRPLYRVAVEAHVDPKTLARIAAGRQRPYRLTRESIARALDRDVDEVFPTSKTGMLRRRRRPRSDVAMLVRDVRPGVMRVDVRRGDWERAVWVLTDAGEARFPHVMFDTGLSTGDAELDDRIVEYVQQQLAERTALNRRPRIRWT